jgi:Late embryogenesis abundant protein
MHYTRFMGFVFLLATAGCATLGPLAQIVQPPRFRQADDQPAQIRLIAPSLRNPTGGAGVRIWLEVTNPNSFGFTLSTVNATLALEGTRAATGDFPLGLPLRAGEQSVVPLDLTVSFADVPGLASVARQAATGGAVDYQLDGTVGVEAGRLGTPTFGPMLLTRGELRVVR